MFLSRSGKRSSRIPSTNSSRSQLDVVRVREERDLEWTLWAHETGRTLWAPRTERALWAYGTERALERTLCAHGKELAPQLTPP